MRTDRGPGRSAPEDRPVGPPVQPFRDELEAPGDARAHRLGRPVPPDVARLPLLDPVRLRLNDVRRLSVTHFRAAPNILISTYCVVASPPTRDATSSMNAR